MRKNEIKGYRNIRFILLMVLILNWLVAIAKVIFGITIRSSSMTADGFHSLSDGASNIIGLVGIHFAAQPTDVDHPYGHKKYETFFSLGIAFLLFLVAIGIVHESIGKFTNPVTPDVNAISFIVMIVTIAVNFIVMYYENKKGKELKSDILVSDSLHTRSDIFVSLSVILALIVTKLGYPILDPIISIIIALLIAYSGFKIMRESSIILCDTAVIMDTKQITDIVLSIEGVRACHKVRTRGRPDDIYVDLHVQVDNGTRVDVAHKICYAIEGSIKKSIPEVSDVVVHIEPIS